MNIYLLSVYNACFLFDLIYKRANLQGKISHVQLLEGQNLETEAWQDLANIYSSLGSWLDAEICVNKTKSIEFYSPRSWHSTGQNSFSPL